jgi:4'-phosphopantetheinyl transferase
MSAATSIPDDVRSFGREVQRLRVSAEVPRLEQHWRHLDSAERQRADRFRNDADRARFVIARSSLRQLLGRRIGVASGEIRFGENEFGKPFLQHAPVALHFNSTHSGDWVLHAIDTDTPIGIDVETIAADLACIDQFERVLSTEEFAALNEVPLRDRARAFAMVWVRKEAYVKAVGEGMSRPLRGISIALDAKCQPQLLYDLSNRASPARWQFEDLVVDARHVACLVHRHNG